MSWSVPISLGTWHVGDTFDVMATIPDGSVDMVLCDLPYGTTQNKWDSVLPLDRLWSEYWRICTPNAAVVLTAAQPFTSVLVCSQLQTFRYPWVWKKSKVTGVLNAKRQPLRTHEDVLVFCRASPAYNAQGTVPTSRRTASGFAAGRSSSNYGAISETADGCYEQTTTNWPKSVLEVPSAGGTIHPTQKPVALFEYLIRTYTDEYMTVLDNTAGSGTTAVACEQSNRRWICVERDEDYSLKAISRVFQAAVARAP